MPETAGVRGQRVPVVAHVVGDDQRLRQAVAHAVMLDRHRDDVEDDAERDEDLEEEVRDVAVHDVLHVQPRHVVAETAAAEEAVAVDQLVVICNRRVGGACEERAARGLWGSRPLLLGTGEGPACSRGRYRPLWGPTGVPLGPNGGRRGSPCSEGPALVGAGEGPACPEGPCLPGGLPPRDRPFRDWVPAKERPLHIMPGIILF